MVMDTLSHKLEVENSQDDQPNPQCVGSEFVKQYYTTLSKAPELLFRFYTEKSSFVHGGIEKIDDEAPVIGQKAIYKKIQSLNFRDCRTKIRKVDSHPTLSDGIVLQVTGEISNNGGPMRRFMQTFVLGHQKPRRYYVINDIFRYQDEIFEDHDNIHHIGDSHSNQNRHNIHVHGDENHTSLINSQNAASKSQDIYEHSTMHAQQISSFPKQPFHNHVPHNHTSSHITTNHNLINGGLFQNETLNRENKFIPHFVNTSNHINEPTSLPPTEIGTENTHSTNEDNDHDRNTDFTGGSTNNTNGIDNQNSDERPLIAKLRLAPASDKHFWESNKKDLSNQEDLLDNNTDHHKITEPSSGPKTYAQLLSKNRPQNLPTKNPLVSTHEFQTKIPHFNNSHDNGLNHVKQIAGNGTLHETKPEPRVEIIASNEKDGMFTNKNFGQNDHSMPNNTFYKGDGGNNSKTRFNNINQNRLHSQEKEVINDSPNIPLPKVRPSGNGVPGSVHAFASTHPDSHQIFVGNLPHTISEQELRKYFSEYGPVVDVKIIAGLKDGSRKVPNYGFVIFSNPDPVKQLISEKPIMYKGHRLNVEEKKNPKKSGPGPFLGPRGPLPNGPSSHNNFGGINRTGPLRSGIQGNAPPRLHSTTYRHQVPTSLVDNKK